jgi:hypothetical protein
MRKVYLHAERMSTTVLRPDGLTGALDGVEAVISCIGPEKNLSPGTLMSVGVASIFTECERPTIHIAECYRLERRTRAFLSQPLCCPRIGPDILTASALGRERKAQTRDPKHRKGKGGPTTSHGEIGTKLGSRALLCKVRPTAPAYRAVYLCEFGAAPWQEPHTCRRTNGPDGIQMPQLIGGPAV